MDIVKYLLARKHGISKQFALLWAFNVINAEVGSAGIEHLKLYDGGRLLLSGYGEGVRLIIKSKEDS